MKKGGGHGKGTAAERKVAVMLSKWWYGQKGFLWRRPGNEVRRYEKNPHSGDIVPTAAGIMQHNVEGHQWPFHVEVKSWGKGKLKLWNLLDKQDRAPIIKIWNKATRKKRKDLKVMLVLRENAHDWLVFMHKDTWQFYFGINAASPFIVFGLMGSIVGMPWGTVSKLRSKKG